MHLRTRRTWPEILRPSIFFSCQQQQWWSTRKRSADASIHSKRRSLPPSHSTTKAVTSTLTATTRPTTRKEWAGTLLCTIKAPRDPSRIAEYAGQRLPSPDICNYTILDIVQSPDGSYNKTLYLFLQRHDSKYLFTLSFNGSIMAVNSLVNQRQFSSSGQEIRQYLDLRGFGLLRESPGIFSFHSAREKSALRQISEKTKDVLARLQAPSTEFFFAFMPNSLNIVHDYDTYRAFLQDISQLEILVIILTITEENPLLRQVQPPSAWNHFCLYYPEQASMEDDVRLIADIVNPSAVFVITLSLRMDIFLGIHISEVSQTGAGLKNATAMNRYTGRYETDCWDGVLRPAALQPQYYGNGGCFFINYQGTIGRGVASFETLVTIEDKMNNARNLLATLDPQNTRTVVWLAHDLTFNLAANNCGGDSVRLLKMRELA
ncbi:uncharacterized protein LOC144100036 [Amblyomma americanum]